MTSINLLGSATRVEAPAISVRIGGVTFGMYNKSTKKVVDKTGVYTENKVDYPNYMQSLEITKINGTVNTYTLTMVYGIQAGDDPNLLEKVFSKASNDRKIVFTYGDYSIPSYIYKEEEAIITKIRSNIDFASSKITYTLNCTSQALKVSAGTFSFPRRIAKPSDVIKELLYNDRYGLLQVFYGMHDKDKVLSKGLIASDDKPVTLEAQAAITPLAYLNYLVTCMSNINDNVDTLKKTNRYVLLINDTVSLDWDGPFFQVQKVTTSSIPQSNSIDMYEVDVGFPSNTIVTGFSVDTNDTYSILYNYSNDIGQSKYIYRINNNGEVETQYSPTISNTRDLMKTTEYDKSWWSQMTQYPINATLSIKGLLKPAILMSYVKVNVVFYGQPYIASGNYIVTKQVDRVDSSGYRTTLSLTRLGEAEFKSI